MSDSEGRAFLFSGLPGAGKTEAATYVASQCGGTAISSGDMLRQLAKEDGLTNPTSPRLAAYASEQRERHGPAFVAERYIGKLLRDELTPDYPLAIDGIRHRQEVLEYQQYFTETTHIWIDANTKTRLERLRSRGREGEDDFEMLDLLQRDQTELEELGVNTLLQSNANTIDYTITNEDTLDDFHSKLNDLIE